MSFRLFPPALLLGACLLAVAHPARAASSEPAASPGLASACDAAGAAAERQYDLPSGLLQAIGRAESGRRDPASGQVAPWPWTINAEGRGQSFGSKDEALATTRALQQSGVASIDVGCFQVNLVHHAQAFPTLDDGFDPARNADYAARFLVSLRARTGSWEAAVAAYHSATPERGQPYRERVMALWAHAGPLPAGLGAGVAPAPFVVRVTTWSPPAGAPGAMHIWTPSAPGQGASIIRITRG